MFIPSSRSVRKLRYNSDKIIDFLDKRNAVDPLYQGFSGVVDMVHSGDTVQQQATEFNKKNKRTAKETAKQKTTSISWGRSLMSVLGTIKFYLILSLTVLEENIEKL